LLPSTFGRLIGGLLFRGTGSARGRRKNISRADGGQQLVGVEHRESFEKGDRIGLVSVALGPPAFLIWRETVCIDDGRAMLALADIAAAELVCLS
jgi:hypothetical protein